jgi:hypothetical protein
MKPTLTIACVVIVLALGTTSYAQYTSTPTMTLAQNTTAKDAPAPQAEAKTETVEKTETVTEADKNWDIFGPIRLRSADPEELGEVEVKLNAEWGTSSSGEHDSVGLEPEIEYGIAPNHELIWAIPMEFGFGGVDGNADQEVGWHWRLWKEDPCGILPAFAIRNFLRMPSGYHSSGVDWTFRGLFTKSIIPNKLRVHLNPYFALVNGDNLDSDEGSNPFGAALASISSHFIGRASSVFGEEEESHRYFRWGIIPGVDYKLCENINLVGAYIYENSPYEGQRDQHSLEFDVDWKITEHHEIGFVNRMSLDGDSVGDNFSIGLTYIYVFDNVPHLGCK